MEMKNRGVLLAVVGLVAAAILAVYLFNRQQTRTRQAETAASSAAAARSATAANPRAESGSQSQFELSTRALKANPSRSNGLALATELAHAKAIKLHPGQILARVNGVPITLRDLLAIDPSAPASAERSMSEEQYKYLLDRAIDRELAFQAAQQQGVKLTEAQQAALDRIEQTIRARDTDNSGLVASHLNNPASLEAIIDFEKRDAAGLLTQEALLAHSGGLSPYVTEDQVKQYYQQNIQRYGPLPTSPAERDAAWQQIDAQIRIELNDSARQAHQAALNNYMDGLKAAAQIQVSDVKGQSPSVTQ
ncbi:MAG TPA: hypothetical protein VL486_14970 [Verrucomicrobiae bacterium]|nr:hypothetical protein [Verrucomicrobiae bacterium]